MDIKATIDVLTSPATTEEILEEWLFQMSESISYLEPRNENVVNLILKLKWTRMNEKVCQRYIELIWNLVTAYNAYLRSVLKMIISYFVPDTDKAHVEINEKAHQLLNGIVQLIPFSSSQMMSMLVEHFPYMRKSLTIQTSYIRNLTHITTYLADSRPAVLELITVKLLQMDVHCPRDLINETEDVEEFSESLFPMDTEVEVSKEEMRHPLVNALDALVTELLQFICSACFMPRTVDADTTSTQLNWEETRKVYKELLAIFDAVILPTHACAHIQFIMFYICSLKKQLCEGFVDFLWKKVNNPNVTPIIRQASACYLGSLLARAKYVPISMVHDCLALMCSWVNGYIENQSGSSTTYVDAVHHATFYAVCQVIFYLITFRHKEIVTTRTGRQLLCGLNIERIVNCRLNPLRVCQPIVVKNFATVARNYQIAYCYTIIERNSRLFLPTNNDQACTDPASFSSIETFFPFDPYLLKRSGKFILPEYRHYEGQPEVDEPFQETEDQDFLPENFVFASPQVHSLLPELLHHGVSPGFRQNVLSKFR